MHAQITAGVERAYKDTVSFAPGADNEDGNPTCARTDFTDNYPRACDCSNANGAMPTASSEICEKAEGWLIEISPEQNQAGMENFKNLVCEGVEDAEEAKDETESGFQTNFLSATLIALCALF